MAFIGFKLPNETIRLLSEIEVPEERVDSRHMHVTLVYLGDEVPIKDIALAMGAAYKVASYFRPFTLRTSSVSCFKPKDGPVPIICPIESKEIHQFQKQLREALDEAGVSYSKKFPDYKPHTTLAFAENEIETFKIPPIEWGAHEVVIWGGDEGDQRIEVRLPFSLKNRVAMRYRLASVPTR